MPLLQALADSQLPPPTRIKALHALRRVFSAWWHAGHLHASAVAAESSAPVSGSRKRHRDGAGASSAAAATITTALLASSAARNSLTGWLRAQFYTLLEVLLTVMATAPADDTAVAAAAGASGKDATALRIAALRTAAYFMAHATSKVQQEREGGQHFGFDVLVWWLRHALTVDASASAPPSAEGKPRRDARVETARSVLNALAVFRAEFIDEYDDVRYYTARAVALLAGQKAAAAITDAAATGTVRDVSAAAAGADAASVAAFSACEPSVFQRNAVDLLLAISLPFTQKQWEVVPATADGGEAAAAPRARSSWVRRQWEGELGAVYSALDARVAVGAAARAAARKAAVAAAAAAGTTAAVGGGAEDPWRDIDGDAAAAAIVAADDGDDDVRGDNDGGNYDDDDEDDEFEDGGAGRQRRRSAAPSASASSSSAAPKYSVLHEQRRAYAEAWVAVLRIPAPPPDVRRRVLLALPTAVLPHMPGRYPLLLADYLTSCLAAATSAAEADTLSAARPSAADHTDAAPATSPVADALLALQSLFVLMNSHGLEYPRFYAAVYALLTPAAIGAKHRGRLFKLLDLFLSSTALPAYLVAAFVKRTARLALTAPAPFALFALPFVYNCVKRHPAVTPLLHRAGVGAGAAPGGGAWPASSDPFDASTNDPAAARALSSSLWELLALGSHYHAPVANLARSLTMRDAPTRAEYDVGDAQVYGATYGGLLGAEVGRTVTHGGAKVAAEVPFAFRQPASLLGGGGGEGAAAASPSAAAGSIDFSC